MRRTGRIILIVLGRIALLFPCVAPAQSYPSKPVHLVVGGAAQGPSDFFGRTFAEALSAGLSQPVIVENKIGGGGVLGIDLVAKAAPDGYTLGFNNVGSVAIAPYALSKMPFNPNKDLAFITTVVKVPEVIAVNPSLSVNSLTELIAYAKANPGKIKFGSEAAGGIAHLTGELLKAEAHIDVVYVPYKGAAPAVSDLLDGKVQMGIFDVQSALRYIHFRNLKALAVTSVKRAPPLPEVPTTAEFGYPKVISNNWYGLVAPAGTPPAVLQKIHEASMAALRSPTLLFDFDKAGGVPAPSTPEEYLAFLGEEQRRWSEILKAINFKEN